MGAVSTYFGLGTFAGFLVFNTAGVYLMGIVDRLSGLSAALRFSILPVVLLSVLAAGVFSLGVRHNRESVEWRAMLLGLALTAGYWALVAIASALLVSRNASPIFILCIVISLPWKALPLREKVTFEYPGCGAYRCQTRIPVMSGRCRGRSRVALEPGVHRGNEHKFCRQPIASPFRAGEDG